MRVARQMLERVKAEALDISRYHRVSFQPEIKYKIIFAINTRIYTWKPIQESCHGRYNYKNKLHYFEPDRQILASLLGAWFPNPSALRIHLKPALLGHHTTHYRRGTRLQRRLVTLLTALAGGHEGARPVRR